MAVLNLSLAMLAHVDPIVLFSDHVGAGHLKRKVPFFWLGGTCPGKADMMDVRLEGIASSTEIRELV